jgi:hypothetical protein
MTRKRQWLNSDEDGGMAAILTDVNEPHLDTDSNGIPYGHVSAAIKISDCSRQISLDFDVYNLEGLDNARLKINRLYRAIAKFRTEYLDALSELESHLTP